MAKKKNRKAKHVQITPNSEHRTQPLPYHTPVLLHQSIEALNIKPDGIYVDATFGGGGHSREIISHIATGHLFSFDQDPDAAKNVLTDKRFTFIPQNFRHMKKFLRLHGITQVDGILADLGVSSWQFDQAERGFSIRFDADLDMRMNTQQQLSATDVLNTYTEKQLQQVFSEFGEIRNARQLAEAVKRQRTVKKLRTTKDLVQVASSVVKGEINKYLSQVFQSVRMEVNDETGALKEMMEGAVELLQEAGRLVIISYHSLEDRMVKHVMRTGNAEGEEHEDLMGRKQKPFLIITKKPVAPGEDELKNNPRSRSAKMRVGERVR